MSRPSASVLRISTVWAESVVTTSPGLVAWPPGMFSQVGMTPTTLTGASMPASARSVPSTEPAPVLSNFISSTSPAGLREMPPAPRGAEQRARARHVEVHRGRLARGLERDAAGVEGDALADERDRFLALGAA